MRRQSHSSNAFRVLVVVCQMACIVSSQCRGNLQIAGGMAEIDPMIAAKVAAGMAQYWMAASATATCEIGNIGRHILYLSEVLPCGDRELAHRVCQGCELLGHPAQSFELLLQAL